MLDFQITAQQRLDLSAIVHYYILEESAVIWVMNWCKMFLFSLKSITNS
ncbi:MAG: Uncharacterised protein [Flavobacterium sp. SCGC AAA160-P02]|nr:MAG: Uncharacterised protein [Flavobacterium sp. SCGC AAA160-P02]